MKVILLTDVKGLGSRGEVKNVKDGYGRNFLIPRNFARHATPDSIEEIRVQEDTAEKQVEEIKTYFKQLQDSSSETPIMFSVKVGERGEVFSSVTGDMIKEKLVAEYPGVNSPHLKIEAGHIRELGRHEIPVNVGKGIEGNITIEVVPVRPS